MSYQTALPCIFCGSDSYGKPGTVVTLLFNERTKGASAHDVCLERARAGGCLGLDADDDTGSEWVPGPCPHRPKTRQKALRDAAVASCAHCASLAPASGCAVSGRAFPNDPWSFSGPNEAGNYIHTSPCSAQTTLCGANAIWSLVRSEHGPRAVGWREETD